MKSTPSPYAAIRHCDIYRAKDAQYYTRLETALGSELLLNYGPFETAATALARLQINHAIGDNFFLDDSGRRSVPTDLQP